MRHAILSVVFFLAAACDDAPETFDPPGRPALVTPAEDAGPAPSTPRPDASTADATVDAPAPKVLAMPVAALASEVAMRSPGTELGLAVRDLGTGEYAGANDSVRHVSASSPKAIWVAAAIDKSGIAAITPYAQPIFANSDNAAAGSAIDLAGGMNAINVYYASKAGMTDSAVVSWYGGRSATNSPNKMDGDNYFTAKDAVEFLTRLDRGTLLDAAGTKQLEEWLTLSPRKNFGGWLGTLLPDAARAALMHKGGWLPPGCCGDDGTYNTLNEIGIVLTPNGHRYAVAILARGGDDWYGKQAPWVERASCVIYRAVSADAALMCND